jgi:Na+/melibiose symporter-like transporter
VAGAGIAVGPILGGWATTELSWRVVFVGEVVLVVLLLVASRWIDDAERPGPAPTIDLVGTACSALGLGLLVLGVLTSSSWGWVLPKASPVEPLGFSLSLWLIVTGGVFLWAFVTWQRRRERTGADPLLHLDLLRVVPLRAGLLGLLSQNLILMGVFFVVPLYLQLVLGFDALQTGVRMLPVSITMFLASAAGARLSTRFPVRTIVRTGLVVILVAIGVLLATIEPDLQGTMFAVSMGLLGLGIGLLASQLGNVVQSSVDESGRGEAGGLQYTGQQLGASLGVALVGAVVLSGLTTAFVDEVQQDDRIPSEIATQLETATSGGVDFVEAADVESAVTGAGIDQSTTTAIVENYSEAQLRALKAGLLLAALLAIVSLPFTKGLPSEISASTSSAGPRCHT